LDKAARWSAMGEVIAANSERWAQEKVSPTFAHSG
jgi:hypothetical protein